MGRSSRVATKVLYDGDTEYTENEELKKQLRVLRASVVNLSCLAKN